MTTEDRLLTDKKYTSVAAVMGYMITVIRNNSLVKKQKEFAELLGLSHTGLAKIERGESSTSLDFLFMIAGLIGTTPDQLLKIAQEILILLQAHNILIIDHSDSASIKAQNSVKNENTLIDAKRVGQESLNTKTFLYGEDIALYITPEIHSRVVSLITNRFTLEKVKEEVLSGNLDQKTLMAASGAAAIIPVLGMVTPLAPLAVIGLSLFSAFATKKYASKDDSKK